MAKAIPEEIAELAARIRGSLPRAGISERRMFGGLTFLHRGNMLCCATRGGLMVRVGAGNDEIALSKPHTQPCMGTGRRMRGFFVVDRAGLEDVESLEFWLEFAIRFVSTLPEKA
jgi:hypothetical protein